MSIALLEQEHRIVDAVDRWFRELDQRRIYQGAQEWLVEVTSIFSQDDLLWIQMVVPARSAGSVLLCVRATTPTEQAVRALGDRTLAAAYPTVVNAT